LILKSWVSSWINIALILPQLLVCRQILELQMRVDCDDMIILNINILYVLLQTTNLYLPLIFFPLFTIQEGWATWTNFQWLWQSMHLVFRVFDDFLDNFCTFEFFKKQFFFAESNKGLWYTTRKQVFYDCINMIEDD